MALFQKGQSGNPKGRPKKLVKKSDVEQRFALDVDGLFAHLEGLARHENPRVALDAIKLLLAYRLGTPTQRVEMTGANGGPVQFEDAREQFAARIAALAARRDPDASDSVAH